MRRAALLSLAVILLLAAPARGALLPVQTLDGPSSSIVALDGVAMAGDGSGGLVYRKRAGDGHIHVYAAQFVGGTWLRPRQVDVGQAFDSSWPTIGAGDGGRLVVTWVQPFSPSVDALWSASLDPGARTFQTPLPVDQDIGRASATYPSLAMNDGGQAYLVYRVETNPTGTGLPPGYVGADLRMARYDGAFWTPISALANRNRNQPVPRASAANAPKIGIDVTGNGLVAFDEPDDDFVDRVWARRIFGPSVSVPLLVSPQTWGGMPLRGAADELALSESGFGQGAVAFRQQPGAGGALTQPRVMAATIPESSDNNSGHFAAARLVDGTPVAGTIPGALSVSVQRQGGFAVGFGLGSGSWLGGGDNGGVNATERLDDGSLVGAATPQVDVTEGGAASQAWNESGAVAVHEVTAGGVGTMTRVASNDGGAVSEVRLAGSGVGDAAIAFRQGDGGVQEIAATAIDAAPLPFVAQTPIGWTRAKRVNLTWDDAQNAIGGTTYSITVDDQDAVDNLTTTHATLGPSDLPDGKHVVRVIASDRLGQQAESDAATVRVDRHAPAVTVRRSGRSVRLVVRDGASGVRSSTLRVSFGDGRRARSARARHAYGRPGRYTIVVQVSDKAGNHERVRRVVRVP
ncbi:MAG: domain containing protein [Solirubrobacterales bacterium]|nr:domain containing protein [Solirubrobacterales bacterium]